MGYPYQTYLPAGQAYPQQVMQPVQQPMPSPVVRPVTSLEEARAVQTDFSGAMILMPDTAHGFIYTKQINWQTGSAEIVVYRRADPQDTPIYVKKADFDELARRFNALCDQLGGASNEHGTNADAGTDGQ